MAEQDIELDVETGEEVIRKEVVEDEDDAGVAGDDNEDERVAKTDDDELDNADDEDERESIRERRRQERKHRKEAQREREDTLRRELAARDTVINEMRSKLDVIERRNTGSEQAQLENAKKQTAQAYAYFKDQIKVATNAGNGEAVADATEKMMQAQRKFDELATYEKAIKQRQSSTPPLDPRLANHADAWMKKNPWYDASGKDQDSEIAMRLDQRLAQEGWDPTTAEYWTELDSRVKKYLPHRMNAAKMNSTKPKSVVASSGRESSGSTSKATYKLSAERVKALKDAGIWDDPKQRAEAITRYRDFDKQNSSGE